MAIIDNIGVIRLSSGVKLPIPVLNPEEKDRDPEIGTTTVNVLWLGEASYFNSMYLKYQKTKSAVPVFQKSRNIESL